MALTMPYSWAWLSVAGGSSIPSISSISSPNTLPCPQPVVTTRFAVFSSIRSMPRWVLTAAAPTSQSTVMDSISKGDVSRRWLRR
jgi:hypothetical protein